MALSPGTRLGSYEVVDLLGEGGMGEVYRARDTRLGREVAIKIVLGSLVADADRIGRFRREAQVLAALNHPNIAHLYGFEDGPPAFLVMELVSGPTLADLIPPDGMPLEQVLPVARQIADALEAAHEQGIIHRDLKPANVKVRDDGTVKVLDFGLAKAAATDVGASAELANSPTLTARATQLGVILGTAAYMAPEQAKGRTVDRRADIWSFGAVVYEMLTGSRAFKGEDVSDTLAAVLRQEIDWRTLPAGMPARLRRLLERCLDRDPKTRLRDIGEARVELARIGAGTAEVFDATATPAPQVSPARRAMPLVLAALGGVTLALLVTWAYVHGSSVPKPQPAWFAVVPPVGLPLSSPDRDVAISPDGAHIAYIAGPESSLMVSATGRLEAVAIPGITGARAPFFSPDGKRIGFFQSSEMLMKVSVTGGPAEMICRITAPPRGASWGDDDTIVFATADPATGLFSVPSSGGVPKLLTKPDVERKEVDHQQPSMLPGSKAVLFTITGPGVESNQVAVLDLSTGKWKPLVPGASQPEFVAPDMLVYGAAGTLRAVRFDPSRLDVLGDPVLVLDQVAMAVTGATDFDVSKTGTIVYIPGSLNSLITSMVWIDRKGQVEPVKARPGAYYALRLAPEGSRVALDIRGAASPIGPHDGIWIWHVARETLTPITFDPGALALPVWTPDGNRIVYSRGSNLFSQAADGTGQPEQLVPSDHRQFATSFSHDGTLLFTDTGPFQTISMLTLDKRQVPSLIHATSASVRNAEVSPDGHWVAYESSEGNPTQVYVRPFPDVNSGRWQISANGGTKPVWAPNGHELFYETATSVEAVTIQTTPTFSRGNPVKLFDLATVPGLLNGRSYDTRDGQRFIVLKIMPPSPGQTGTNKSQMVVGLNWIEELRAKLGGTR